jgi:hypothetical protein
MSVDVKVSDIYHWQRPELEQNCTKWVSISKGSVWELRERLTTRIRSCVIGKWIPRLGFGRGNSEAGACVLIC